MQHSELMALDLSQNDHLLNERSSDKTEDLEAHRIDSMDKWFDDGINTPGLTLIRVQAAGLNTEMAKIQKNSGFKPY
jgi:hypothetical protein